MDKSHLSYTVLSLMLASIGLVLTNQQPPFYLDIVMLVLAMVAGLTAVVKRKK